MTYIRTVISFEEENYYSLKQEAAKKRQSLSSLVREKVGEKKKVQIVSTAEKILSETKKLAKRNIKHLKGLDGVTILREMRDNTKW